MIPTLDTLEEGRAYLIDNLPSRADCMKLSRTEKGFIWRGNYFVTHNWGRNAHTFITLPAIKGIRASRAAVQELTGIDRTGWTYSRLARDVTGWLDIQQYADMQARALVPRFHYQHCWPGPTDGAKLYDMKAAYWQTLERIESPCICIVNEKVLYETTRREAMQRWRKMLEHLKPYKRLRVAIVGVNSTGKRIGPTQCMHGTECFYRGRPYEPNVPPGNLQPLALLAIRNTYELCQEQSKESDSIYSNGDCVCTEQGRGMKLWEHLGVEFDLKAHGPGDIRAIGAWSLGTGEENKATGHYPQYIDSDNYVPFKSPEIRPVFHTQVFRH